MKTIKGPALFLAQFAGDTAPFNSWDSITKWAADCGYVGVQVPSWDGRLIDLDKAASSKTYCDELKGVAAANGVQITELSTHLQGQLVAVHPAYDAGFDGFAAPVCAHRQAKGRGAFAFAVSGVDNDESAPLALGFFIRLFGGGRFYLHMERTFKKCDAYACPVNSTAVATGLDANQA